MKYFVNSNFQSTRTFCEAEAPEHLCLTDLRLKENDLRFSDQILILSSSNVLG